LEQITGAGARRIQFSLACEQLPQQWANGATIKLLW
jgi:hypothetical protein